MNTLSSSKPLGNHFLGLMLFLEELNRALSEVTNMANYSFQRFHVFLIHLFEHIRVCIGIWMKDIMFLDRVLIFTED